MTAAPTAGVPGNISASASSQTGQPGRPPRPRRRRLRAALLVLPAVIPVAFVVIGGVGTTLLQSLGLMPLVGAAELSTAAFDDTDELLTSALLSLSIAVVSTAIAAV
ncbi:MAG: hypothetical protein ACSHW9_13480, partial [Salinibacterium amurskyense]